MLSATQEEIEGVTDYMRAEAPDLTVTFVQKVYAENVLHVRHDVRDVHTNVDRWWVITQPMNLYAQGAISKHGSGAHLSHRPVPADSTQRAAAIIRAAC